MSPRVDQRDLAKRQRRTLKQLGYDDREIQVFAQIFKTDPDTTEQFEALPPCEQAA